MALHVNKLEFSSPKNTLCQVWLIMAQWFWEVDENMKGLRRRQRTGKSWSGKLSWAFGSGELKGTRLFPIFKELVIFLKGGGSQVPIRITFHSTLLTGLHMWIRTTVYAVALSNYMDHVLVARVIGLSVWNAIDLTS